MNGELNAEATRLRERKLRLLYELLDCENNKKVVTEADRLLKKQSNFTTVKILKALAFIRMGKTEEAKEILELAVQEVPTEDSSIQALSICYKEMNDNVTMSKVLEAASKKLPSEELMTHSFMALVRNNDYTKQQHTAMSLYKMYCKPTYFGWAVASLLMKADKLPGRDLSLKLAEAMLSKFIKDKGQTEGQVEESILLLYLETLAKQKKWEEVLSTLKELVNYPDAATTAWNNDYFYQVYTQALMELGKKNELYNHLQASYFKNTEEYHLIYRIITLFSDDENLKNDVKSLLNQLLANFPSYVTALADLCHAFATHSSSSLEASTDWVGRVRKDLQMACTYGANKPSFSTDMIPFVTSDLLSEELKTEFMEMVATKPKRQQGGGDEEVVVYDSVRAIIRDVNYELIERDLFPDPGPLQRISRAERCLQKYFSAHSVATSLRSGEESDKNLITKEADYHDQFLVIAASSLMAKYDDEENDFGGVLEQIRSSKGKSIEEEAGIQMESLSLNENTEGQGGKPKRYVLNDQDYLLMTSILLMEFGLKQCPYNHSLRILLIKAYTRIGAIHRACMISTGLDLKHIQWDSLGYLIIWKVLRGGLYAVSRQMLNVSESVYTNYKRDCMEHLITAYKYGSFQKIHEFDGFREQLLSSCQFGLIQVEKGLLQLGSLTMSSSNQVFKGSLAHVAKNIEQNYCHDATDMFWKEREFTDNRDFTILQYLEREKQKPLDNVRKATAETDMNTLRTRKALLILMSDLILLAEEKKEHGAERLQRIDEAITIIRMNMENFSKLSGCQQDVPNFDGLWPSPQLQYFEMGCLPMILEQVEIVRKAIVEKQEGGGNSSLVLMSNVIIAFWNGVSGRLTETLRKLNILTMGRCIEEIHHAVETLSFTCILFNVALQGTKNHEESGGGGGGAASSSSSSSRRKKKTQQAKASASSSSSSPPPDFTALRLAHNSLRDFLLEVTVADICSSSSTVASWSTAQKEWEGLLGEKLREQVFSPFWDGVQKGIVDSYGLQLDQFMKAVDNNIKFIAKMESGGVSSAQ